MRSELFDNVVEEELNKDIDYFGEIIKSREISDKNVNISDDLETLQNHYSILLDYILEIERNSDKQREEIYRLNNKIEYYENIILTNDMNSEISMDIMDRINRKISNLERERDELALLLYESIERND